LQLTLDTANAVGILRFDGLPIMEAQVAHASPGPNPIATSRRAPSWVFAAMEIDLLVITAVGPWMYGAVHPGFELVLDVGLLGLLALWGLRMLTERRATLAKCPVTILLAIFVLLGFWQTAVLQVETVERLAPATAALHARLVPQEQEIVPTDAASPPAKAAIGETLSLYPEATRTQSYRLLAVLLLFAAVRNNLATPGVVTRFAFVMALNGVALCFFGLVQFFTSSSRNLLYWTYPALGQVFGPFVSRNMFPFYVSCCIGLALGLVLARRGSDKPRRSSRRPSREGRWSQAQRSVRTTLSDWLDDVASLWLVAAIAFMSATVAFTLSRGGMLGLLAGFVTAGLVAAPQEKIGGRIAGFSGLGVAVLLFVWLFGLSAVQDRLDTLWTPDKADTARIPLWERTLPIAAKFPAWGTGLGSFQYVELWSRGETPLDWDFQKGGNRAVESSLFDHAHNDYLEVLVELGVPGLLVILSVLVLTFHYGLVAARRRQGGRTAGLATGCLMGVTAVAVHSFVDFGMRGPAIAWLVTVICAMVCGLGADGERRRKESSKKAPASWDTADWQMRFGVVGSAACAAVLLLAGLVLCVDQWRAHRVDRLRAAATSVPAGQPSRKRLQLPYLEAAARLVPRNAAVQMELARCRLDIFRDEVDQIERKEKLGVFVDTWAAAPSYVASLASGQQPVLLAQAWNAHWLARNLLVPLAKEPASRQYLIPGLQNCITARNACPLMPEPHIVLGLNAEQLTRADSPQSYFDRARFLAPRLPDVWYFSGLEHLGNNEPEKAWSAWRQCLSLSDRFLDQILIRATQTLTTPELLRKVLPDQPELILAAAERLNPREKNVGSRALFYKAALIAYGHQNQALAFPQIALKARIEQELSKSADPEKAKYAEDAETTVRIFLVTEPWQIEARLLLANLLLDHGKVAEAKNELSTLLTIQPGNPPALELRAKINHRELLQDKR
jgi:O-antigen ligase/tetratricopeptide (TPR) repeat protein